MTLGLSLAIALGAGLHLAGSASGPDPAPGVLRKRFEAAWDGAERSVAHVLAWDIHRLRAWRHTEGWSIRYARSLQASYGLRLESASRHPYGDMRCHRRQQRCLYGDRPQARARHRVSYADLELASRSFRSTYWLTGALAVRQVLPYAVTDVDPVARRLTASWSLLDDARLQAVVNSPELIWSGQKIRIVQATLSCDEDSPVWIAQIEVAAVADFARMAIGDAITLALGLETFVLVIDGKTLSRESPAEARYEVTAVSPLALHDAPFAGTIRYYESAATVAASAVETLIGPVDWQLPDWIIPANRLFLENVTPLAAARNIVAAIGGIIESAPDGGVICRRRHPVSIPLYGEVTPAGSLFDAEVISARAQIAPLRGYNRITIANEEGTASGFTDRIEYVADADDPYRGTVRVYLAAARNVVLAHTGHAATVVASLGTVTRAETELVELIEGRASTRYPVTAITASTWLHNDLGTVTPSGQALVAAVPGYSLLRITYTTTSLDWRVALPVDEEVQFVLVDV